MAGKDGTAPGAARLHLADGAPLRRPEEQVFEAMLDGWRNQQLARNLALSTINGRERKVRAFAAHADAFLWNWSSTLADEWFGDLRAIRGCVRSTLRGYQEAVRLFCDLASPLSEDARRRSATSCCRPPHPWSPACSATTTAPRLSLPPRREEPGSTMPQGTTHGDHEPSHAEEYATLDYARSPVRYPRFLPDPLPLSRQLRLWESPLSRGDMEAAPPPHPSTTREALAGQTTAATKTVPSPTSVAAPSTGSFRPHISTQSATALTLGSQ